MFLNQQEELSKAVNQIEPVSYTHLDVYKRQTPYISCDTVEAILKQEPDYGRVFDDSVKFDGTLAVSYTHLISAER